MAATLDDIAALADDVTFRTRVKAAMMRTAVEVTRDVVNQAEVNANDKARRQLAIDVINDRDTYAGRFASMLAAVDAVTLAITDAQLIAATRQAWNYLAQLPI